MSVLFPAQRFYRVQPRGADGWDQGSKDGGKNGDCDDDAGFLGIHGVGDRIEGVDLRVPDDDAEALAEPGVQLVDVVDGEPREQQTQAAADDADDQAVAKEDSRYAAAGRADAFDDA